MAYSDSLFKVKINTPAGEVECVGGSYDGVPFFMEESSVSGGRNVITTALPYSADHVNEDSGLIPREFPVNFYLVGEDVEEQREKLEEAFNKEGPLELVHPHYGRFLARARGPYTISFSGENEYISGEITFVPESTVKKAKRAAVDVRGQSVDKSAKSASAATSRFNSVFSLAGKARSVVDKVADASVAVLDSIEAARSSMRKVSQFVSQIGQIRDNLSLILKTPADFSARMRNLLELTEAAVGIESGSDESAEYLTALESIKIDSGTLPASKLVASVQSMSLMILASMVVRSVMDRKFSNADEVYAVRKRVSEVFETVMDRVQTIEEYADLADMEATLQKYLVDVVSKLATVVDLPLLETRDALSACFDCYGTLDKLDEVLERNEIVDPMVVNRRALKVLSK